MDADKIEIVTDEVSSSQLDNDEQRRRRTLSLKKSNSSGNIEGSLKSPLEAHQGARAIKKITVVDVESTSAAASALLKSAASATDRSPSATWSPRRTTQHNGHNANSSGSSSNHNKEASKGATAATATPKSQCSTTIRYSRIFKKSSQDGNLVLFLPQRELMITETRVEPLMGVALVHQDLIKSKEVKVFLQVVLIFRYGREDEELMGLRFCNEIVISAEQIYPSALEEACKASKPLVNPQGFLAVPFVMDMGVSAPPSVRLLPCRPYSGSPIGTTYEVQLFAGRNPEEMPKKRRMVQMSLRLFERLPRELPTKSIVNLEKNFMFSENTLTVQARLDSGVYCEDDTILLNLQIHRSSGHGVKKIKVITMQQVGVAMFSTGNFKNSVGCHVEEPCPSSPEYKAVIPLHMELTREYSWIAMDETAKKDVDIKHLAPSVVHATKSMFIIRVQYYVQVLLCFGMLHRPISIKLPFLLKRAEGVILPNPEKVTPSMHFQVKKRTRNGKEEYEIESN